MYFPGCDFNNFSEREKREIENDIQNDFDKAFEGIVKLPLKARFGVYVAYKYYLSLFKKIRKLQAKKVMEERIRIPNYGKVMIVAKAGVRSQFKIL
jgi:phytoene/squalene synthetase